MLSKKILIKKEKWYQVERIIENAWQKGLIHQYRKSPDNSFYFKIPKHTHHIRLSDHMNAEASNGKISWVFRDEVQAVIILTEKYKLPDV